MLEGLSRVGLSFSVTARLGETMGSGLLVALDPVPGWDHPTRDLPWRFRTWPSSFREDQLKKQAMKQVDPPIGETSTALQGCHGAGVIDLTRTVPCDWVQPLTCLIKKTARPRCPFQGYKYNPVLLVPLSGATITVSEHPVSSSGKVRRTAEISDKCARMLGI